MSQNALTSMFKIENLKWNSNKQGGGRGQMMSGSRVSRVKCCRAILSISLASCMCITCMFSNFLWVSPSSCKIGYNWYLLIKWLGKYFDPKYLVHLWQTVAAAWSDDRLDNKNRSYEMLIIVVLRSPKLQKVVWEHLGPEAWFKSLISKLAFSPHSKLIKEC